MFTLDDLKQTRYFQDVIQEAKVEQSRKSILTALEVRFITDNIPSGVIEKLNQIEDFYCLDQILEKSVTVESLTEFCSFLEQLPNK